MSTLLRPLDALLPRAARNFGGKARNVAMLARAGFPVPAGYALSCEAAERCFEQVLPPELRPASLFPRPDVPAAAMEPEAKPGS